MLVECQSRYLLLVKLDGKDTTTVMDALCRQVQALPEQLRQSLTWVPITTASALRLTSASTSATLRALATRIEREYERLLRQYLPRRTDLSHHTQHDLDQIALRLNTRPRRILEYQTPAAILDQALR
jgi:transposase, IS30 family